MGALGLALACVWLKTMKHPADHPRVNREELEHIVQGGGLANGHRRTTPAERKDMQVLYNTTLTEYRADAKGALALASAGEYARPKDLDPVEHAALTCVCNALLNLDEVLVKE